MLIQGDSLTFYTNALGTTNYLQFYYPTLVLNNDTQIIHRDSVIELSLSFKHFGQIEINNWNNLTHDLKIYEVVKKSNIKRGIITVPLGKEDYWVTELRKYSIIVTTSRRKKI